MKHEVVRAFKGTSRAIAGRKKTRKNQTVFEGLDSKKISGEKKINQAQNKSFFFVRC